MRIVKDYIRLTKVLMNWILGINIDTGQLFFSPRQIATTIFYICIITMNLISFIWGGLESEVTDMTVSLPTVMITIAILTKYILMQVNFRKYYAELFEYVDGWYMAEGYPLTNSFGLLYEWSIVFCLIVSVWQLLLPYIFGQGLIPSSPYKPLWDTENPVGYAMTFSVILSYIACGPSTMFVSDYAMFFCFLGFYNRLIELKRKFESITDETDLKMFESAIKDHQIILRKLKILQVPSGWFFFLEVFFSFINASFLIFSVMQQDLSNVEAATRLFSCFLATYCRLFIYCWLGQHFIDATEAVRFGVYNNEWYNFDPKNRKTFFMVQIFTNEIVEIKSPFVLNLSHETFQKVGTEVYSFIMVLVGIINKGE
nr:olfactory receptor 2 [Tropidothorax elegans]